jgi:thiosulfate/3-mercaptopyruvate sulfurtransferase
MQIAGLLAGLLAAQVAGGSQPFISVEEAKALAGKPDVRFVWADADKDFDKGHVPGSVQAYAHDLQYLDDVRKCEGLPMCEATANAFIGKLGIGPETTVVVYDSGIGVQASGTWFFLTLYGQQHARILEGGLAAWKAQGLALETGAAKPPAAATFKAKVRRELIATRADVESALKQPDKFLLLDARHKLEEYSGKELLPGLASPGKEVTVARGGFIPSAVFSPWTKYAGNKDGAPGKPTLKDEKELQKQLEKLKKNGYDPKKTVISYCHVGLGRGSFQYLALLKAGHADTRVYVGGWSEWGNTPELPLGTQP